MGDGAGGAGNERWRNEARNGNTLKGARRRKKRCRKRENFEMSKWEMK